MRTLHSTLRGLRAKSKAYAECEIGKATSFELDNRATGNTFPAAFFTQKKRRQRSDSAEQSLRDKFEINYE
jgi:hypothetical protein